MITCDPYPTGSIEWRVWTLTEPWATLMVTGAKWNETRSRALRVRGPVLIHAAKAMDMAALRLCADAPFAVDLARAGIRAPADFRLGCIIGAVTLTGMCFPTRPDQSAVDQLSYLRAIGIESAPFDRYYGNYGPGRFIIPVRNHRRCAPVPARGALGLWRWTGAVEWR